MNQYLTFLWARKSEKVFFQFQFQIEHTNYTKIPKPRWPLSGPRNAIGYINNGVNIMHLESTHEYMHHNINIWSQIQLGTSYTGDWTDVLDQSPTQG